MRSTTLLLTHVALGYAVPVRATVEDLDDGTCRVTVGTVGAIMAAEHVRRAEEAVAAAERWERRVGAKKQGGGA